MPPLKLLTNTFIYYLVENIADTPPFTTKQQQTKKRKPTPIKVDLRLYSV